MAPYLHLHAPAKRRFRSSSTLASLKTGAVNGFLGIRSGCGGRFSSGPAALAWVVRRQAALDQRFLGNLWPFRNGLFLNRRRNHRLGLRSRYDCFRSNLHVVQRFGVASSSFRFRN